MKVSKWGNSLAIRLPASVVEALELKDGDDIEVQIESPGTFAVTRSPDRRALLARLRQYRGMIPAAFKFARLEAHERE